MNSISMITSLYRRFKNEKLLFEKQSNTLSGMLSDYSNQKTLLDSYEYSKSNASFQLIQGQAHIAQRLESIQKLISQQQETVLSISRLLEKIRSIKFTLVKGRDNPSDPSYQEQVDELTNLIDQEFKEQLKINLKVASIITEIYPISEERIISLLAAIIHVPMISEDHVKDLEDISNLFTTTIRQ